ncbi:hypothetical protein GCM10009864_79420 [Streptomyces lunalinharesii]|uniref:Uncharacterized protein n=1 Tax=Streptomyces lunalinharesii TaxID=333384 RepID=A0ABP6FNL2_9ACTN
MHPLSTTSAAAADVSVAGTRNGDLRVMGLGLLRGDRGGREAAGVARFGGNHTRWPRAGGGVGVAIVFRRGPGAARVVTWCGVRCGVGGRGPGPGRAQGPPLGAGGPSGGATVRR